MERNELIFRMTQHGLPKAVVEALLDYVDAGDTTQRPWPDADTAEEASQDILDAGAGIKP